MATKENHSERAFSALPGGFLLLVHLAAIGGVIWLMRMGKVDHEPGYAAAGVVALLVVLISAGGFFVVNPNEAKVLQLFGRYVGTVREPGLRWALPLYSKRKISQRAVSLQSDRLKVNDADGNPIEIAAIIVWRVTDTAKASFDVEDHARYILVQSESALRNLAQSYPYDAHDDKTVSLRGSTNAIADHLKVEVQERVALAGLEVVEARISHLAYAPEIAQAMLQRQQASAIVAARTRIVEGAVGMVELALQRLSMNKVVELDEERKAQMVANLLVVLCGERAAQPIVNAGTLHG